METQPKVHPAPEVLRALVAGQLDSVAADAAFAHLESCPVCRETAATLSGDSFLRRLREARPSGSTTPETRAAGDTQGSKPGVPTETYVPPDILPELRDHPQYEVVRELGRGGMGVVYLVRNKPLDRVEVLKVVGKHLLDSPRAVERFQREIRSAAKLSNLHIVTAHAAFQAGNLLVFAMEYVEGETLAEVVKARGRLPVVNACYYAQQVAQGLQHAYERGMVHRDIKPQNLILARQGKKHTVKILDFGLAKATRERGPEDGTLTGAGAMLGTPDYIAPEQTVDAAAADIRADIYSLGCTLYFLLTGAAPFQGKSAFEVLQAQQSKEAVPLDQVRADVPANLAAVVTKMMAKDPARRYQQPAEVVQALAPFVQTPRPVNWSPGGEPAARKAADPQVWPDTVIAGPGATARPTGRAETERNPLAPARPSGKRTIVLSLGAAGLLGIVVLGAVFLLNRGPKTESAGDSEKGTNQGDRPQKNGAADQVADDGAGTWEFGKAPANLRTTVDFVDYEVASSRWNGRVWEFVVAAKSRRGKPGIRFYTIKVVADDGKTYQLGNKQVTPDNDIVSLSEDAPTRMEITMSTLPPTVKKLSRVELTGNHGNPGPSVPVIFLDVPIAPDRGANGNQAPPNLRTTVDFVDYEVASSRWNGRVWELVLSAKSRIGKRGIRFYGMRVLADDGKTYQLGNGQVTPGNDYEPLTDDRPRKIVIAMSTLPPAVKKLERIELNANQSRVPVVFLDVPINPDPASGSPPGNK